MILNTENVTNEFNFHEYIVEHTKEIVFTAIVLFVAFVLLVIIKFITSKIKKRKHKRSYTVVKLLESICRYVIIIICIFVCLAIWGVDVSAALAGVGVVGLVLGLGAQDLIKDFLAGIGIVFEDQYEIDEVVEINGFKGKVVEIGLRTTRLINATGEIRIIRNGSISEVSNFSRTFSLAAVTIEVSYEENLDEVIALLDEKLGELKEHYPQILEGPIVAGVESLNDSGIAIKITAKTEPEDHYAVQRAILKYSKELFDINNIEMPYPQVVIHEAKKNE